MPGDIILSIKELYVAEFSVIHATKKVRFSAGILVSGFFQRQPKSVPPKDCSMLSLAKIHFKDMVTVCLLPNRFTKEKGD